jgi:hypothetical protein
MTDGPYLLFGMAFRTMQFRMVQWIYVLLNIVVFYDIYCRGSRESQV